MKKLVVLLLGAIALAGCGGDDEGGASDSLTVYSGREEELVAPLFERFEQETGIDVEVRYADSAELAATIAEEGDNSPAYVFFAQDAGSLGAVGAEGLLSELPAALLDRVDARYRDPEGRWVGTSGRSRVVAYDTDIFSEDELPDSIWDYAEERWRGKVGLAPTNASFQAMITAMRLAGGEERTRQWLEAVKANEPRFYENNVQTLEGIAAGEVEVGFVNHYYLHALLQEQPDAGVANHYLAPGDPGALVNVAGAGILGSTQRAADARAFVEFLLGPEGQQYVANETDEYPLIEGIEPPGDAPPLSSLHGPDISLGEFGKELEATLELLASTGFTS
jgi:iron(III) transport system substrate-binding protein